MSKRYTSIFFTLCAGPLSAQDVVDIGLFPSQLNDTVLEVYVRPTMYVDGVVSGLTFTIQWPATSVDTLRTRTLTCPDALVINPVAMVTAGGFHTRTFNAFGTELLADWGCEWAANQEHLIVTIPVYPHFDPLEQFRICDYFISHGGIDVTGVVYSDPCQTVGTEDVNGAGSTEAMVIPNPADDQLRIVLPAGTELPDLVHVFSLDGRCVITAPYRNGTLDVSELAGGLYDLRVGTRTVRFIKT